MRQVRNTSAIARYCTPYSLKKFSSKKLFKRHLNTNLGSPIIFSKTTSSGENFKYISNLQNDQDRSSGIKGTCRVFFPDLKKSPIGVRVREIISFEEKNGNQIRCQTDLIVNVNTLSPSKYQDDLHELIIHSQPKEILFVGGKHQNPGFVIHLLKFVRSKYDIKGGVTADWKFLDNDDVKVRSFLAIFGSNIDFLVTHIVPDEKYARQIRDQFPRPKIYYALPDVGNGQYFVQYGGLYKNVQNGKLLSKEELRRHPNYCILEREPKDLREELSRRNHDLSNYISKETEAAIWINHNGTERRQVESLVKGGVPL